MWESASRVGNPPHKNRSLGRNSSTPSVSYDQEKLYRWMKKEEEEEKKMTSWRMAIVQIGFCECWNTNIYTYVYEKKDDRCFSVRNILACDAIGGKRRTWLPMPLRVIFTRFIIENFTVSSWRKLCIVPYGEKPIKCFARLSHLSFLTSLLPLILEATISQFQIKILN